MTAPTVHVSVVLPCLNERTTVGQCIKETKKAFAAAGLSCEVIVADNGSTDGSAEVASRAGARVVNEPKRGYGSAYLAGINAARGRVLVLADADGTYPLSEAPDFARRAEETEALILGSRFRGQILPGSMPVLHRAIGSPATRLLLAVLFGVRGSDPHSGMRALTRSVFDIVRPVSTGMEFAIEMVVNASRRGVPVIDIPITYSARVGESKLRALPDGWALFRFLILHSPTFLFVVPGGIAIALGAAMLVWLSSADRTIGTVNFGINSLVVGALATIVGYQIVALGACARAYMAARDPAYSSKSRWFTLERGIVVGLLLVLAGIAVVASVGARWLASDFPELQRSDHGLAIVGLTAAVVGMETIFSSFFLSLLSQFGDVATNR